MENINARKGEIIAKQVRRLKVVLISGSVQLSALRLRISTGSRKSFQIHNVSRIAMVAVMGLRDGIYDPKKIWKVLQAVHIGRFTRFQAAQI